jgi:hypothetical protein
LPLCASCGPLCLCACRQDETELEHAKLFAKAIRFGPFEETAPGSCEVFELEDLAETLEVYMPEKLEAGMTIYFEDGTSVELSQVGATLYACKISTLTHVRNQFNKLLDDRKRESKNPEVRVKSIERRTELTTVFTAISADQLKKGVKALGLSEGSKPQMVDMLVKRFAPKRQRKRARDSLAEDEDA